VGWGCTPHLHTHTHAHECSTSHHPCPRSPPAPPRFKAINGILLPGGGATLAPGHAFYDAARLLVEMAVAANDAGDYYPVHGTCLGWETLAIVVSGGKKLVWV
jgi:hypothetical protein